MIDVDSEFNYPVEGDNDNENQINDCIDERGEENNGD